MEKVETNGDDFTVNNKFGGRAIPVSLSSDYTVRNLKSLFPRDQKRDTEALCKRGTPKLFHVGDGV